MSALIPTEACFSQCIPVLRHVPPRARIPCRPSAPPRHASVSAPPFCATAASTTSLSALLQLRRGIFQCVRALRHRREDDLLVGLQRIRCLVQQCRDCLCLCVAQLLQSLLQHAAHHSWRCCAILTPLLPSWFLMAFIPTLFQVELSHVGACMTATLSSSHTSPLVLADARIGWPVAPSDFACRDFPP